MMRQRFNGSMITINSSIMRMKNNNLLSCNSTSQCFYKNFKRNIRMNMYNIKLFILKYLLQIEESLDLSHIAICRVPHIHFPSSILDKPYVFIFFKRFQREKVEPYVNIRLRLHGILYKTPCAALSYIINIGFQNINYVL